MEYPLLTALNGYGVVLGGPEQLEAYWAAHDVGKKKSRKKAVAYVNHGRWLFDCPECYAGDFVLPGYDQTVCRGCGTRYTVKFPDEPEMEAAAILLDARATRENQNWNAQRGETVKQLATENELHGVG